MVGQKNRANEAAPPTEDGASLRTRLLRLLEDTEPESRLPSERELALRLGVARMTLRKAMDTLEDEGRLRRVPKKGAYVTDPKLTHALTIASFTEDMVASGRRPSTRLLSLDEQYAGETLATHLGISATERVWRFVRLRLADDIPLTLETVYTPHRTVPQLTARDIEDQSWYRFLADRYGSTVVSGEQTIEPTLTDEQESIRLDVPLHSPAFLFVRTCRDQLDRSVEHVRAVTRGDRFRLHTTLTARHD